MKASLRQVWGTRKQNPQGLPFSIDEDAGFWKLRVPSNFSILIQGQGRVWKLRPAPQSKRAPLAKRELRPWVLSFAVHSLCFITLWGLTRGLWEVSSNSIAAPLPPPVLAQPIAGASGAFEKIVAPFQGIAWTQWIRKAHPEVAQRNQMKNLSKLLQTATGIRGVSVTETRAAGVQGLFSGWGGGPPSGGSARLSEQMTQNAQKRPAPTVSGDVSEQDRVYLKELFARLEHSLKDLYSRLLTEDPTLSVSVRYEASVQPNGFLSKIEFQARGKYRAQTLEKLLHAIRQEMTQLHVDEKFKGKRIRGESFFTRT